MKQSAIKASGDQNERDHAVRTSVTHPLRVDWLPLDLPGRIGLTFAPGKKAWSKYTGGRWERDLDQDLDRLVHEHGAQLLVSLIEEVELRQYGIEALYECAAQKGLRVRRFPIRDVRAPTGVGGVASLVEEIVSAARGGRHIVIHCIGGLGRTGTVAGCVLVDLGHGPQEALDVLHQLRGPHCPETREQETFVAEYAAELGTRTAPN